MSHFENATPRPWRAEGPDMFGDFNIQGPVYALAIGAVVSNMRLPAEVAANAELIVTAVNARDGLMNAAQAAVHALKSYQYGNSSPDLAQEVIAALEAALNLARGERS